MSEEIFGGELDVTEETPDPFETDKSQVRQYRDWLHKRNEKQLEILKKVESALENLLQHFIFSTSPEQRRICTYLSGTAYRR